MGALGEIDETSDKSYPRDNAYILYTIVCGAIYGLCSNMCFDRGAILNEGSEIAFLPDLIYRSSGRKVKMWARTLGSAIQRGHHARIPLSAWNDLIFELFLGKDTETFMLMAMNAPSNTTYMNSQNPDRQRLYLGAQANGMIAVADILVTLSNRLEPFCHFHISRGQLLNFPLTEAHNIEASTFVEPALTLDLDLELHNTSLYRFDSSSIDYELRVDIEPCWYDDPRTVIFVLRSGDVPISRLDILAFVDRMSYEIVECKCQNSSWDVNVRAAEWWQLVTLHQMMRTRFKGMSTRMVDVSFGDHKILIDGS